MGFASEMGEGDREICIISECIMKKLNIEKSRFENWFDTYVIINIIKIVSVYAIFVRMLEGKIWI